MRFYKSTTGTLSLLIVFGALAGLFYFLGIAAQKKQFHQAQESLKTARAKIASLKSKSPDLKKLVQGVQNERTSVEGLKGQVSLLEKGLWDQKSLRFLLEASAPAFIDSPTLKPAVSTRDEKKTQGFLRQAVKVALSGNYATIADYLNGVEKSSPYLSLRSLKISHPEGLSDGTEEAEMELEVISKEASDQNTPPVQIQTASQESLGQLQDPFLMVSKKEL